MRTLFIICPSSNAHNLAAEELERTLVLMMRRRNYDFRTRSYWDDGEYETEYGVRLEIHEDLCREHFLQLIGEIVVVTGTLNGESRIQLGDGVIEE